jgi:CheY-like chemotaxis protein
MNNKKVLICEDDEGIIEIAGIVLEDMGYEVVTQMDGHGIFSRIEEVKPDLLLLDLWLPGLTGDQITRQLKAQESTKHMPIVIMSANKDTEKIAKEAGADAFLAKPFDLTVLETTIAKHITNCF